MISRPPPILCDGSSAFAHDTIAVRVPKIVEDTIAHVRRSEADSLRRLLDDLRSNGMTRELEAPAPDLDEWAPAIAAHAGATWQSSDMFFGETYAYRRVVEAVRYWELGLDPFRAQKEEELGREATWLRVEAALAAGEGRPAESAHALLLQSLWGNRMDLSYALASARGTEAGEDDLLVDDRDAAVARMTSPGTRVDFIADNAGTELLVDLTFADALLAHGASRVVFHVKAHPLFVSDTIVADAHDAVARMRARGGAIHALGVRLTDAIATGRLRLAPDTYWCSSYFIDQRPPRIDRALFGADVAIIKGDANYRRFVGDALWDTTTAPCIASGPLPVPMIALRTSKSEPIVGLAPGLAERLQSQDATWRWNGKHGVAQWFPSE